MGLFKKAKSLLDANVIGVVHRFRSSMYTSEVFSRKKGWYYDRSQSGGGVVINVASHLLYLLHWYFSPVRSVFAQAKKIYLDVEDAVSVIFECGHDVVGSLDTSWSVPGYRLPYIDVRVEGDNGTLELNNDYIKLYLYKAHKAFPKEWTTIHKIDLPVTSKFELGAEGLYEEDQDFIDCCLDRTSPAVTWQDGLEVQRLIEAIYRSAERRTVVALEEVD
jgi:predicted dehydrogenase